MKSKIRTHNRGNPERKECQKPKNRSETKKSHGGGKRSQQAVQARGKTGAQREGGDLEKKGKKGFKYTIRMSRREAG